jgi:hypothetical protein
MDFALGNKGNYHWLEVPSEDKTIGDLVHHFPNFILGKQLAVICFDSGSFNLTDEETQRGWYSKNEIAYFDQINSEELEGPIYDNYDQWLIFDSPTEISDIDSFVNYSGFSLSSKNMKSITDSFWKMIERNKPSKFILCGDFFIYGTLLKSEIEEMSRKWFSTNNNP